jgi:microcystin-dependent protein
MDPFIGMIRAFAFNIVPKGWAQCNGQLLPINQNQALFAIIGTTFGGDGQRTFGLPDLRGRAMVGVGNGPGLDGVANGQAWGANSVTLTASQMPVHVHMALASSAAANNAAPAGQAYAKTVDPAGAGADLKCYGDPAQGAVPMLPTAPSGGSQPLNIQNPFLGINYCIAIQGIFPSRS